VSGLDSPVFRIPAEICALVLQQIPQDQWFSVNKHFSPVLINTPLGNCPAKPPWFSSLRDRLSRQPAMHLCPHIFRRPAEAIFYIHKNS